MNNIKLTKRLSTIASLVNYRKIADVGCDHGKLVAYLFENNLIDYAYVSDISQPSLNKAVRLLNHIKANFDYECTDGISANANQCDLVIISGMGGSEIIKILSKNPTQVTNYILQPQHNEIDLKKYLIANNFCIEQDIILKDKKFYNVIKCIKCDKKQKISKYNLYFGTNKASNPDFMQYIDYELNKVSAIISKVPFAKRIKMKKYLKLLNKAKECGEKV